MERSLIRSFLMALGATFLLLLPLVSYAEDKAAMEQEPTLGDSWKEGQIETAYLLNEHLSTFKLDAHVVADTVRLSGTVESDIKRDLAGEIALGVAGIETVINEIDVEPELVVVEPNEAGSFGQKIKDATISAGIKTRLIANQHIDSTEINVSTNNGIVTLEGKAPSGVAKELAEQLARNVSNVKAVENEIVIEPMNTGSVARQ